ncbi:helix-turn-helix domain-containing protein [Piscirickettsia litoralis]|nr:hypothetical protein [Piscirickettsia litoralis]
MTMTFNDHDRRHFIDFYIKMDAIWAEEFDEEEYTNIHYATLFFQLWNKNKPVSKTDAYRFMHNISSQTAQKYLNKAIKRGSIIEIDNPEDKRSKLVTLSKHTKNSLIRCIDATLLESQGFFNKQK